MTASLQKYGKWEIKTLWPEHLKFYLDATHTRVVLPTFYLELMSSLHNRLQYAGALQCWLHPRTYTHATRQMQDQAAETMGSFMTRMM